MLVPVFGKNNLIRCKPVEMGSEIRVAQVEAGDHTLKIVAVDQSEIEVKKRFIHNNR